MLALLSSRTIEEAAGTAGVTPRTLYRWMKDSAFDSAYRETKRLAFPKRSHGCTRCVARRLPLGKIMVDANAPASTRVRAADCIFNHTAQAIEIEDI